jgi:tRNA pseudouridine55 synthase
MTDDGPSLILSPSPLIPYDVPMDGFLLIDKPANLTSHDVVDAVRKISKTRRVGHAGTLDPFATGLLILGINKATKKLGDLIGLDKTYDAVAELGATSTTDDPEGSISHCALRIANSSKTKCEISPSKEDIEKILTRFQGTYVQTAPAFSAKKVGGKKLYELARNGKMEGITLPKKEVTIHELNILSYEWPNLAFRVQCSSGTYIRALARDIGQALGTGAYLTALRRTSIGPYNVNQAIPLHNLTETNLAERIIKN